MAQNAQNAPKLSFPSNLPDMHPKGYGNRSANVIVFIHGWPDLPQLWDQLIEALQADYYCVTLELPNYDRNRIQNKWGYDLVTVSHAVAFCIKNRILKDSTHSKVTLIIHDWGTIIGLIANKLYPYLFNRIAAIDVGDNGKPSEWSIFATLFFVAYQWYNIAAFFSPSIIGDFMTRQCAKLYGTPLTKTNETNKIHAAMNYFYWTLWKRILTNNIDELTITSYPTQPVFFVYGEKNPLVLHTNAFRKHLTEREDCECKGFDKSSHWIMFDEPQRLIKELKQWLKRTNEKVYKIQSKL